MKKLFYFMLMMTALSVVMTGCDDDEDNPGPQKIIVTLGAQDNAAMPGFYSVAENKTYTQDQGFQNQSAIDIFCFYEAEGGNNIALASPGTGITGIFTGSSSVENWTTTDTTFFYATTLTPDQFNAITTTDDLIETSFNAVDARRKAKDMKINDIYSIKIQSGQYGLLMVTAVTQGADGSVTFELKMKE